MKKSRRTIDRAEFFLFSRASQAACASIGQTRETNVIDHMSGMQIPEPLSKVRLPAISIKLLAQGEIDIVP